MSHYFISILKLVAFVLTVFVVCGAITTFTISKLMSMPLTLRRTLSALLISFSISASTATLVIYLLIKRAQSNCGDAFRCGEIGGMVDGGFFVLLLWLAIYSMCYIAVSFMVASRQKKLIIRGQQELA